MADIAKTLEKHNFFYVIGVGSAVLHPIWIKKRLQIGAKIDDKIDCLLDRFLEQLFLDCPANLASNIDAKSRKNRFKMNSKIDTIRDEYSVALGSVLEAKFAQNPVNIDHKPTCKLDSFLNAFLGSGGSEMTFRPILRN